jgi:FkbM family methyltransferase
MLTFCADNELRPLGMIRIRKLRDVTSRLLGASPISRWPVRVRKGLAKGALWTAFPYSAYWRGNTEMDVEAAIRLHGSMEGGCCWDLGTHYGIYSVGMAMAVGPRGQVAGFEPDPVSFAKCRHHVEMNKLNWVKLFNAAVSERQGTDRLLCGTYAGSSTSHLRYEDERMPERAETLNITLVTLDSLVERDEIRLADFIKVDVEGHGAKALAGAHRSIVKARPTMVMSFHSELELAGTRRLLEPLGYCGYEPSGRSLAWEQCLYRTAVLRPWKSQAQALPMTS